MTDSPSSDENQSTGGLPRPQAFHITDPFEERGLWYFWLTADDEILDFVARLNCVLDPATGPFRRRPRGRVRFAINPRYDHEEAWLWINDLLNSETSKVELNKRWEDAIDSAHETPSDE